MRYLKLFFAVHICIISGCQTDSTNFSIDYEKFTLENGLEKTIRWFLNNQDWWLHDFENDDFGKD